MDTYENNDLGFEMTPEMDNAVPEPAVTAFPALEELLKEQNPEPAELPQEASAEMPAEEEAVAEENADLPEPPVDAPARKKLPLKMIGAVAAAVAVVGIVGGCLFSVYQTNRKWEAEMQILTDAMNSKVALLEERLEAASNAGLSVSGTPNVSSEGMTPAQVYAKNKNAVVAVTCTTKVAQFGQVGTATSSGSGFVLTEDGYVITNYHVIEGADTVSVITYDGTEHRAMVQGYDSGNDIAVLKIQAEGLQHVQLGSSNALIIGDMVVAIGNPLGELNSTQTVGYISGKDRDVATDGSLINMLQTDAAINSGNSGGPLFNMNGEVIGIITAKYSGTTSSGASIEGIGFAIPIDDVTKMIGDIMQHGYVTGAYLGVSVSDVTAAQASYSGYGAYVEEVVSGYCAANAGVRPGDLIIGLGEYEVTSVTALTRALRNFDAGDSTTITVLRKGRELVLEITLDEKPNLNQQTPGGNGEIEMPEEGSYDEWYDYFYHRFYGKDPDQQP